MREEVDEILDDVSDKSLDSSPETAPDPEEEKRLQRTMLYFPEGGIVMNAWDVVTIRKTSKWMESHTRAPRMLYGISINENIQPSIKINIVDVFVWYEKIEYRDKRFDQVLEVLIQEGISVITL